MIYSFRDNHRIYRALRACLIGDVKKQFSNKSKIKIGLQNRFGIPGEKMQEKTKGKERKSEGGTERSLWHLLQVTNY